MRRISFGRKMQNDASAGQRLACPKSGCDIEKDCIRALFITL